MSNSPIKRDKSLLSLSKEHHFGLLASWKIRRGFDLKVDPKRMANFVNDFWLNHLNAHFIAEEKVLFNKLTHKLIDEALQQHAALRLLIKDINENGTVEQLTQFADLLEQHIRFEERQVFKLLQQELPEDKLSEIALELNKIHDKPLEDNYKDEFWLVKD